MSRNDITDSIVEQWRRHGRSTTPPKHIFRRIAAMLDGPPTWVDGMATSPAPGTDEGAEGTLVVYGSKVIVRATFTGARHPDEWGQAPEGEGTVAVAVTARGRLTELRLTQDPTGPNSMDVWSDVASGGDDGLWPRSAPVTAIYGDASIALDPGNSMDHRQSFEAFLPSLIADLGANI